MLGALRLELAKQMDLLDKNDYRFVWVTEFPLLEWSEEENKNTGKVAGKEVAEVYVTAPKGAYEKPAKELKTFGKTRELKPGESQTLKMTLEKRDLASFDEANSQWKVDAGNYLFKIGSDVENIKGTATLKVAEYTEKTSNACAPNVRLNYLNQK